MKNVKLIASIFLVVALSSCKKEKDPEPNSNGQGTATPISSYADITLGNHNNADFGSFINLSSGAVYKLSTDSKAVDNQSSIDLVYYYNNVNHTEPFIGAPTTAGSNFATGGIFDNNPDGINFWTVVNNTEFGLANDVSVGDFNAITNLAELQTKWGTLGVGLHYVYSVQSEKIYRFKTANNKIGFLKINTIVGSGETIGTMSVDVKIQQ